MRHCDNCGAPVIWGEKNCPYCGGAYDLPLIINVDKTVHDIELRYGENVEHFRGYLSDLEVFMQCVEHGCAYRDEQGRLKLKPSIIKKKMNLKIIEV